MRKQITKIVNQISNIFTKKIYSDIKRTRNDVGDLKNIFIDEYIQKNLFDNPKYDNPKRLSKSEFQIYSQNGEDGIIQEIFKRIGTTNKYFIEFGSQNGLECNTLLLLIQGWSGCWMDGSATNINFIKNKFNFLIDNKLIAKEAFITAENIESLLSSIGVPKEPDVLSIDIDGNDYWVWKAINKYSPRLVVIEYNSIFRPPIEFITKYEAQKKYEINSHFGASLKSLEKLGQKKGYKLVACNFTGANAFFVREDLVSNLFFEPYTAENHYEPPRYFLLTKNGHFRDFGKFNNW